MPLGELPDIAAAAIRTFSLLNEMGIAMRMDGDTLRAVISARTAYANPDDVIAKLQAISPDDILAGRAGESAKAIAAASPGSPFAADLTAGYNGLMVPTAAIGAMAAVAIPAFLEYMKKSKVSESALQLNRLAKYLRAIYAANSAVPIGTAPLTPATPCCDGPDHKCFDPAAWTDQAVWKELDFSVDEAHLFRYDYASTDGKTFVAHAVADLDCDGEVVTYTLSGEPDGDMLKVHMSGPEGTD
jgi:type II secretory pathway pseudopilin PulG